MGLRPPRKHEKIGGGGLLARHSTGLMVRRTHPTLNFGGTGFQPVLITGKMPVPSRTFVSALKVLLAQAGKPVLPTLLLFWVSQRLMNGWFPSSRLGTPLQAKLLLCERIIYLLHWVAQAGVGGNLRSQAGAWERGKGGMRCAFPPYALIAWRWLTPGIFGIFTQQYQFPAHPRP